MIARPWSLAPIAALALAAGTARADEAAPGAPHTIAILSVEGSSKDVAQGLEAELEARLGEARVRFVPRARLREQLRESTRWTEGCLVGACLSELRAQTGAGVALLAALTGAGTTFGYVVTLVRTDTGRVLAQKSDRCDVCTQSEATGRAVGAAVELVGAIPDRLAADDAAQGPAAGAAALAVSRGRAAERRAVRRVGWTLTLVGLAAASVGAVVYLAGDDRPAGGLAAAAGGGGLALGGVAVLVF